MGRGRPVGTGQVGCVGFLYFHRRYTAADRCDMEASGEGLIHRYGQPTVNHRDPGHSKLGGYLR